MQILKPIPRPSVPGVITMNKLRYHYDEENPRSTKGGITISIPDFPNTVTGYRVLAPPRFVNARKENKAGVLHQKNQVR